MANRLGMATVQAVLGLKARRWSNRRIALELGIDRETVARYVRLAMSSSNPANAPAGKSEEATRGKEEERANAANAPAGNEGETSSAVGALVTNPANAPAGMQGGAEALRQDELAWRLSPAPARGRASVCEPYRQQIKQWLECGLTAQRVYQDLRGLGFEGSLYSVQRFVRQLLQRSAAPYRRLECEAGAEAQVDFGSGGWVVQDGKRRRPHVFRLVLSHSRKGYSEAVWRQTTESFLRCLENAFWHFGGVPRTLVIDNLKAAVSKADWYDPETNPKLQSFCAHYGTVLLPTKPRTPRHKGKIERGVGYVKGNGLRARVFASLAEQNEHLQVWEQSVADCRIHGTTKRHVGQHFEQVERAALLPLPPDRFPCFKEERRTVHKDGHIEVQKAYYSAPPEFVGRRVWVRWDERTVRLFNSRMEQVALHPRIEPGKFHTDRAHLLDRKISLVEEGAERLLARAALIGVQTGRWAQATLAARGIAGMRVLVGLLSLARQHSAAAIESACDIAMSYGSHRLRTIRQLIGRQALKQERMEFLEEHPLIRRLDDYGELVRGVFEKEASS